MSALIPEKRVNKNGVAVTKHVRPLSSSASKAAIPAPAVLTPQIVVAAIGAVAPHDQVWGLPMRVKNQLEESGYDFADAALIRHNFMTWAPRRRTQLGLINGRAKSLLVDTWHEGRMPKYRFTHNKPVEYPWTKSARDMFFAGDTTNNLVLEHNKPVAHLLNVLFEEVEKPECTDQTFFDLLVQEHSGLNFAVLTGVEDKKITAAKNRDKHVESEDGLERYIRSELDTSNLMALSEDERFNKDTIKVSKNGKVTLRKS